MKKSLILILAIVACLFCTCAIGFGCSGNANSAENGSQTNEQTDPSDNGNNGNENENEETETFTVTFYNENNEVIESYPCDKNTVPACDYEKADTENLDYTFKGWSLTLNGNVLETLPPITNTINFYAIIETEQKPLTINFNNITTATDAKIFAANCFYNLFSTKTQGIADGKKSRLNLIYDYFLTEIAFVDGDLSDATQKLNGLYKDFYNLVYDAAEIYKKADNVKAQALKELETLNKIIKTANVDLTELSNLFENAKRNISESATNTLAETLNTVLNEFKNTYSGKITEKINAKAAEIKAAAVLEIRSLTDNALSKIDNETLRKSLSDFRDTETEKINAISSVYELTATIKEIYSDVQDFILKTINDALKGLKDAALENLDASIAALTDKISDEDLKSEISSFYQQEITVLNAITSINDAKTAIDTISNDTVAFVSRIISAQLTKLKNNAKAELDEIVSAGLSKLPDSDLKTQLNDFYNVETAKIDAVTAIEDVEPVLKEVLADTQLFIKKLVASAIAELRETAQGYFNALNEAFSTSPYDFLPATMIPGYGENLVNAQAVTYDFSDFVNVSNIKYGGFGKQWNMVIDNIRESEYFYKFLNTGNSVISAAVTVVNEYLSSEYADTINKSFETDYFTASISLENQKFIYLLQYKTGISNSLFGEISPLISMEYDITSSEKVFFVSISETIRMRFVVTDDKYEFGLTYGISKGSRSSYLIIERKNDGVEGHVYEYLTVTGHDVVPSCADFYINSEFVSVVGNKAEDPIKGMKGYVNELYKTNEGKLLGFEVRETISSVRYNTLWFNLNDIEGITSIKIGDKTDANESGKSTNDVYLNGSKTLFSPTYNKKYGFTTSRKYDIEFRTQYFYSKDTETGEITEHEVKVPMLFIQANNDTDHNYSDYPNDMLNDNGITSNVNLDEDILNKILADYDLLVDALINNQQSMTSNDIKAFINA